jgi:hypothetical protein
MSSSQPIPISTLPQMSSNSNNKDTPASSISISPQTPALLIQQNLSTTAPNPNSGILQWARSFKSPPQMSSTLEAMSPPAPAHQQKGFDIPAIHTDDHDHDEHDSFEFGDLSPRSWGSMGRRTVSMSMPSGQGITGMLSGFGATSPPKNTEGLGIGSPPTQGVMADKTARGQGVLRRLSISGSFAKVCLHRKRTLMIVSYVLTTPNLRPARSISFVGYSSARCLASPGRDRPKSQYPRAKGQEAVGLKWQEARCQPCK